MTRQDPTIPVRELRSWLWGPAGALVFVLVTHLLYAGSEELRDRSVADPATLLAGVVTGLLASLWRGGAVRRWGAAGFFVVQTVCAYPVFAVLAVPVSQVLTGGGQDGLWADLGMAALYTSVAFLATFWVSLPIGAATGWLAWTYAHRHRAAASAPAGEQQAARRTDG